MLAVMMQLNILFAVSAGHSADERATMSMPPRLVEEAKDVRADRSQGESCDQESPFFPWFIPVMQHVHCRVTVESG